MHRSACPETEAQAARESELSETRGLIVYRIFHDRILLHCESAAMAAHIRCFLRHLEVSDAEDVPITARWAIFNAPQDHVLICCPEVGVAKCVPINPSGWLVWRRLFMHFAVFSERPQYPVHACCVADSAGRAAVISGTSNAGKTSLTAALLQRGYRFASDDYAIFREDGALMSLPIGSTVSETTFRLLPELGVLRSPVCRFRTQAGWEWTVNYGDLFPTVPAFEPLDAAWFFFVTPGFGGETAITECEREEALWHFQAARMPDLRMVRRLSDLDHAYYNASLRIAKTVASGARFFRVTNGSLNATADLMAHVMRE